jgi:hypothetical protein
MNKARQDKTDSLGVVGGSLLFSSVVMYVSVEQKNTSALMVVYSSDSN